MEVSEIIMVLIVAVLAAYLVFRYWQREKQRPPEPQRTGHGIDVTGITERVQRVRTDFALELQSQPHDAWHRRGLLASAKRAVGRLSYFRRRAKQTSPHPDEDTETHVA